MAMRFGVRGFVVGGSGVLLGAAAMIPGSAAAGDRDRGAQVAGTLDATFAAGAVVTESFGQSSANGTGVVVDDEGRVIVVGAAEQEPTDSTFVMARYLHDGSLDPTFGVGGKVVTAFPGGGARATAVALQSDGRIVVVGSFLASFELKPLAVARYQPDGSLDATFATGGELLSDANGSNFRPASVAIAADGGIVMVGLGNTIDNTGRCMVARLSPDGFLDPAFGVGGVALTDLGGGYSQAYVSVAIQPDGRIVTAGWSTTDSEPHFTVARYQRDGQLDPSLGGGVGFVRTSIGSLSFLGGAAGLALQPDGKIVTAGNVALDSNGRSAFELIRYDPDGGLDPSFGSDGRVISEFPDGASAVALAVALDSHGRIVASGAMGFQAPSDKQGGPALARFEANGSPDPTFGTAGQVVTVGIDAAYYAVDIDDNDNDDIVVTGIETTTGGAEELVVARYSGGGGGGEQHHRPCHQRKHHRWDRAGD